MKIQSKMKALSCSRAANSEVSGGIPPKFELIQAFMVALVTCKNEKDPIKHKGSRVLTRFSPLKVYGSFFKRSRAANSAVCGRILVRDIMVVLHICKNEEDLMKNEDAILLTRLYVVFSEAQGQLTPKSAVEFCLNSNSSKLL